MFADDTNVSIAAKSVAELELMINSEIKKIKSMANIYN